ncbi:MAG: alkane 1-monooxygenase [Rhodobacteraceae bacterium]|nr:alkane 1-monooxygenase [Paracoccaceae bacterium]
MIRYISQFSIVTLLPAFLLVVGVKWGGWWPLLGVLYLTLVNQVLDRVIGELPDSPLEPSLQRVLPITLAILHFCLLGIAIWALALNTGTIAEKILIFIGFGLFFANVSNANGHELIHRRTRLEFRLGKWIFISHLFGHHTSAHLLLHHPYVATKFDPNSARLNESFFQFARRAWIGSFKMGLMAENTRRGLPADSIRFGPKHPYFSYFFGALAFLLLCWGLAGWQGVFWYLGLAVFTQTGLLLTDYIQHYGLSRCEFSDGKFEPAAPRHSWNSPHWFTRHLTLNAVRHSDHHAKPMRPYTELQAYPAEIAPEMPYPAGTMSFIALFPALWRKVMNPRVAALKPTWPA